MSEWDQALADAKKILGNNAVIPVAKAAVSNKAIQDYNKTVHTFEAAKKEQIKKIDVAIHAVQNKVLDVQNAGSKVKNALSAADDELSISNYKLDPKKADDKKKIDQARAVFSKYFATEEKKIDEVNKHGVEYDKNLEKLKNQLD